MVFYYLKNMLTIMMRKLILKMFGFGLTKVL